MKQIYPIFIAEDNNAFLVYVPDLQIYTEGSDFVNAIEMARDAIGLKVIDLEDDNKDIPKPSTYETAIQKAKDDADIFDYSVGILTLVDVDFSEYRKKIDNRTVRRNVALPNWLNHKADEAGINVSRVLQEALIQVLNVSRN